MSTDAEIWRAARDLIADHGPRRAESHATKVLAEMTLGGDFAGTLVWRRILRAVKGLNANGPKPAASPTQRRR
ncbi:hypothetical protein [Ferrovibrio sp.]|uniref:hypothetical protein n=1 Tax=Ferrovibrio sp. TaxID=1917215 RepID=UPI00262DFCB1|nr:hypothetical protein [Ferrovibrio sp.]